MSRLLSPGRSTVLVLVGLVLLSFNLRPAAVSVGPVLAEVRAGLDMSATTAGLLTSLPVLAFAGFGALAPALARRFGVHRVTLLALLSLVVGLFVRVPVSDAWPFLGLSLLALGGMAMANVLLPSLVKLHFPDRIGRVTAIYTGALSIGLTAALILTVPLSDAGGGWRFGLGAWAVLALLAALPWLQPGRARPRPGGAAPRRPPDRRRPHPARAGDGAVLRAPVDAGLRDLRLVRPALARQRLLPHHRRRPGRDGRGDQHPAVAVAARRARPQRPAARTSCWRSWPATRSRTSA